MKWLRNFMYGRYGIDQLSNFILISSIVCTFFSWIFPPLVILSYALMFYCIFRMFSKQYYKRRHENEIYLYKTAPLRKFIKRQKNKWTYRHTHKYLKCPHCHQFLRVPKGKGEITITCPKCHQQFDKRT